MIVFTVQMMKNNHFSFREWSTLAESLKYLRQQRKTKEDSLTRLLDTRRRENSS